MSLSDILFAFCWILIYVGYSGVCISIFKEGIDSKMIGISGIAIFMWVGVTAGILRYFGL